MTVSYATFLVAFPEFDDVTVYPQATVENWLNTASEILTPAAIRFGNKLTLATELFAAHYLVIGARNAQTAAGGGISGTISGPTQSKSVGPVSISYNLSSVFYKNAGFWNMSVYGLQFYQIMRVISAGGLYIPGHGRFGPSSPYRSI